VVKTFFKEFLVIERATGDHLDSIRVEVNFKIFVFIKVSLNEDVILIGNVDVVLLKLNYGEGLVFVRRNDWRGHGQVSHYLFLEDVVHGVEE
jgi:hypothetical protein